MKKNTLFVLLALTLLSMFLIAGCTTKDASMKEGDDTMMEEGDAMTAQDDAMVAQEDAMMEEGDAMMAENDAMIAQEDAMMEDDYKGTLLAGTTTPFLEFTKEDYDRAVSEHKTILLFFYANWCPSCKAEQVDTLAAFDELDREDLIGFRVNYRDPDVDDHEEALAKEHGITYQHTKVLLKDGERLLKAPNIWSKETYLEELGAQQ